jgi:Cellulase (glycosyl hydrolase family 5)
MSFPRSNTLTLSALLLATAASWAVGCAKGGSASPTGAGGSSSTGDGGSGGGNTPTTALHVQGNQLVDGTGNTVRLIGVGRQGSEYRCIQGTAHAVFQEEDNNAGGNGSDSSLDAMANWHINTLRLPLNEDCWLGINGATDVGGDYFQTIFGDYVSRAHAKGFYVVLDLHWNAPGTQQALAQQTAADVDHSMAFWTSVATFFKDDPMVLFELYNEPILDASNNKASGDAWACWQSGCTTQAGWAAAGMQSMVDAVRATGATQVLIANGIEWSNKLDQWLSHRLNDPLANIAAGFHVYNDVNCNNASCWESTVGAVAAQVPVITGEFGEKDNGSGFVTSYMNWADSKGKAVSYIAWSWFVGAATVPSLLTSWSGNPTAFGVGVQTHFAQVAP